MDINIFYNEAGGLNKNKLREDWLMKNHQDLYKDIEFFRLKNKQFELKFSQVLYNHINNITNIPLCNICNSKYKRFIGFKDGYNNFCSKKCAIISSLPDALEKRKLNTIEKYGVLHTSQLDSVKAKQANTNLDKYGTISPTLNPNIRLKQLKSMVDNHGVQYSGESPILLKKSMDSRFEIYKKSIYDKYPNLNIKNIPKEGSLIITCHKCHNDYEIKNTLLSLRYIRYKIEPCTICNPLSSYKYTTQNEIYEYLLSNDIVCEVGNRSILNGKELDIYIPSMNIAIEFNGLYWHSDIYKDKEYHLSKKEICESQGINLIHIWEDDWIYKKDIVLSRLNNLFNINIIKLMSRKCVVKQLDPKESRLFFTKNHLQGYINSSINIGLFYNNELVSAISFGCLRKALGLIGNGYELYRFCSIKNTSVMGAFSKLLKYFESNYNPESIITYANRDWSISENVYSKSGFNFCAYTPINYWYFESDLIRKHRFGFRKDKLVKLGFDKDKTEVEIMRERGFYRIFDCGSIKYKKTFN